MLARVRRLMHRYRNDDADRRGPSDDLARTPPSSSKLREKLQKLAEWRIDPSSIEFEQGASEFHGGYATVSRGFFVSTSGNEDRADNAARAGRKSESHGRTTTRKPIAVKKLKIRYGKDKERVLGLALREARFLTKLSHENVIKLEGFVEDLSENRVWLVFPWAANGNLKDFVASADWEIPERIWLMDDVTRGVEYLHGQDPPIYHGDLKSANVVVNSDPRAIITDFGSARRMAKKDPTAQSYKSGNQAQPALLLETNFCEATNTVTLTGNQYTLRWAAPELLMGDEPGLWSDIWALGWIFYEVMMNAIPFENVQNDSMVVVHVIQGDLPSVADHVRMALVRALYSLMITCWTIDPSKRPTAEACRKSMNWMPMVIPDRQPTVNTSVSRTRSPELLFKMGEMHRGQNDYINASKFYTEALDICTDTADNAGKVNALLGLAHIHRLQYKYSEAVTFYSEVVQICTDIGNRRRRADGLLGLAEVHRLQNEYNKAVTFYSEVVQICTDIGARQGRADALFGLAEVHRAENEYSKAVTFYSEVVQICTDVGNRRGRADALFGLAEVHRAQTDYSKAVTFYSEVVQICTEIGDKQGRADALRGLAHMHRGQNKYDKAVPLYSEAVQICTEIDNRRGRADALCGLAEVHHLQKQYSQAVQLFSEALQIRIDIGDRNGRAWALRSLANVHRDQDQHEDAACFYEQAAGSFEEIGDTRNAAHALNDAAEARRKLEPAEAE